LIVDGEDISPAGNNLGMVNQDPKAAEIENDAIIDRTIASSLGTLSSRKLHCYPRHRRQLRRQLLLDLKPNGRVYRQPRNYSPKLQTVALLQRFAEAGRFLP
jgi:hypothetical protein